MSFVISEYVEERFWETRDINNNFGTGSLTVLSVAEDADEYSEGCLYALVRCDNSKQYTFIWQDDEGDQCWDSPVFKTETEAEAEFKRLTKPQIGDTDGDQQCGG